MTVQHRDIPNNELHEPKDINTAGVNTVYKADGVGSGDWQKVSTPMLQGLAGDGGSNNQKLVTDGFNGFLLRTERVYGSMTITNNVNAFAVGAAVDPTLATTSDFVNFTGAGAPWAPENLFGGMTFNTDRLIVPIAGVYKLIAWANIRQYPTNTAFVGARIRLNGTGAFTARGVITKSNSAGDAGQLNGFGLVQLAAGDFLQLYVASSAAGNLIIRDINILVELVRQT